MHPKQTAFENITRKQEIAHNEHFFSFPTMFSTQSENCIPISQYFDIVSLFAAEVEEPKIGTSGKGLNKANIPFKSIITRFEHNKLYVL